jgi:hypothetical protein
MTYLTPEQFKTRADMPRSHVEDVEIREPGYLLRKLEAKSEWLNTRLRKRYAAPFQEPYPIAVLDWLTRIVTPLVYRKRGIDATDKQYEEYVKDAEIAEKEVLEAADAQNGLFDLPLRADTTATGVDRGGPFGYSEASPYTYMDRQSEAVRNGE